MEAAEAAGAAGLRQLSAAGWAAIAAVGVGGKNLGHVGAQGDVVAPRQRLQALQGDGRDAGGYPRLQRVLRIAAPLVESRR